MATDATGTPTSLGIPTYNVSADAPTGNGNNAQMQAIDALLVARAPLASPAFTGTPTAPTPATADNSTKVATTAYVQAQGCVTHVAHGNASGNVSTSGTTFGTGADLLAAALSFTAVSGATYRVSAHIPGWTNANGANMLLYLNLDGASGGEIGESPQIGQSISVSALISPSAGAHTVNIRLVSSLSGPASVTAQSGTSFTNAYVVIERLS